MIEFWKARFREKPTWIALLGMVGTIASLPVIDFRTVTTALVGGLMGVLIGADNGGGNASGKL